jgi:CspA family cold shock protein
MKTGLVKWFNTRKGYGFIKPIDGAFDVYVHISAVKHAGLMDLTEGQKINFEIAADERTGEFFAENLSVPSDGGVDTQAIAGELGGQMRVLPFAWASGHRAPRPR